MPKIFIKPVSINSVFQGRRFKNKLYRDYETELFYLLPAPPQTVDNLFELTLEFGLTDKYYNKSDVDNLCKPFIDCLQKRGYFLNDNQVVKLIASKIKSPEFYVDFFIKEL